MRAVKAKTLRRKLGFKPADPREYDAPLQPRTVFHAQRTVTCVGARRSYQAVKRNKVLTAALLRAE